MLPSATSLDENLKLNENINGPLVGQLSFRLILNVKKEKLPKNEMKNNQKQWENEAVEFDVGTHRKWFRACGVRFTYL